MSVSLKNHEDRIIALENRNYTKMEIIYSTSPGESTPLEGAFTKTLDNFDFVYFDTLITPGAIPSYGISPYMFSCDYLNAYGKMTLGNDDDATSRYGINNARFWHISTDDRTNYFRIFRAIGLKL